MKHAKLIYIPGKRMFQAVDVETGRVICSATSEDEAELGAVNAGYSVEDNHNH